MLGGELFDAQHHGPVVARGAPAAGPLLGGRTTRRPSGPVLERGGERAAPILPDPVPLEPARESAQDRSARDPEGSSLYLDVETTGWAS